VSTAWCTDAEIQEQLPDWEQFLKDVPNQSGYLTRKIEEASEEARGYLGRYHQFFDEWTATTVPAKIRGCVVDIGIHNVASRRTKLMPVDIEKTLWERNYERAIAYLRDVSSGKVELDVDWPNTIGDTGGHRAVIAGANRKSEF
jgi:phage gp36-like protein